MACQRNQHQPRNSMYRIIETTRIWGTISAVAVGASIIFVLLWGFNLGIDFTGGTSMQVRFPDETNQPTVAEVHEALLEIGIDNTRIQQADNNSMVLKMQTISNEQREQILGAYTDQGIEEDAFNSIGPSLGNELKEKSITALILVILAIIAFVSYAFRTISKAAVPSWVFGIGAIVALVHDVVVIVGVFVLLGHFFDVQIDAYFVTALLTVLGFSVNDTIVVYDRIREGLKHRAKKTFKQIINESINSTLVRSLNTSITTLLVLSALLIFGGDSIQDLVLALALGVVVGTYSSIFIASPLLLVGQRLLKK